MTLSQNRRASSWLVCIGVLRSSVFADTVEHRIDRVAATAHLAGDSHFGNAQSIKPAHFARLLRVEFRRAVIFALSLGNGDTFSLPLTNDERSSCATAARMVSMNSPCGVSVLRAGLSRNSTLNAAVFESLDDIE